MSALASRSRSGASAAAGSGTPRTSMMSPTTVRVIVGGSGGGGGVTEGVICGDRLLVSAGGSGFGFGVLGARRHQARSREQRDQPGVHEPTLRVERAPPGLQQIGQLLPLFGREARHQPVLVGHVPLEQVVDQTGAPSR